mmetsp:Transcript_23297/g.70054  ORF Transcript_23297/g.70054 Transcript_23297/m.70054 type:complete len:525 (-) Transcript_23297:27-1601(-)
MLSSTLTKRAVATLTRRNASSITAVHGRQIIDSRGNPTVEVDITTSDGLFRASCPSGASTGIYEAVEIRDGGSTYMGKGVMTAVKNVNEVLGPALIGMDPTAQEAIDEKMFALDGTPNKGKLGANAILGISLAASKAGAGAKKVPLYQHYADLAGNTVTPMTLPVPCFNVINGGEHAGNKLAFQEFFVIPTGARQSGHGLRDVRSSCPCHALQEGGASILMLQKSAETMLVSPNEVDARRRVVVPARDGDWVRGVSQFESRDQGQVWRRRHVDWRRGRLRAAVRRRIGPRDADGSHRKGGPHVQVHRRLGRRGLRVQGARQELLRPRLQVGRRREGRVAHDLGRRLVGVLLQDFLGLSDRHHRGPLRPGRLGELVQDYRGFRREDPDRGRRLDRHEPGQDRRGHRKEGVQLPLAQGEPDRLHHGVDPRGPGLQARGVGRHDVAPLGRDRGRLHRGPRGRPLHRRDQDGRAVPRRAHVQVQPAPPHRRVARQRHLCGSRLPHAQLDGLGKGIVSPSHVSPSHSLS